MPVHLLRHAAAALGLASALLATGPGALAAQARRVEQLYTADGKRLDFPPDGVWRIKARQVAEWRERLLSQGRFGQLNAPIQPAAVIGGVLQGTLYVPTILVGFKNTDTTALPKAPQFDQIFYTTTPLAGRPYTVRTYYEELSHTLFSVQGQTYGWFLADQDATYYLDACGMGTDPTCPTGQQRLREMFNQAIAQAEASISFSQYDNDGPDGTPNTADDDGIVDLIQFVQPIRGRECSGTGYNAHHFSFLGLTGTQYTTADPSAKGGNVKIDSYQIVAGVGGTNCITDSQIMAIGTAAHELGHGLGLPDLYDTNPADADDSEGIGEFGLMGSGNYTSLISPAHYDAWSLQQMGWVTLRQLTTAGTYSVGAVETSDTVFMVRPLGTNPRGEYFLLENKQPIESDTANLLHGPRPKVGGLLIWHVDSAKIKDNLALNTVNTGTIHGLRLEEADGLAQLLAGTNRGDAGDPYPGTSLNQKFSFATNPANVKNSDGTFAGFEIDAVTQVVPSGTMRFALSFGGPTVVRAADTLAQVSVDGNKYRRFAQLLAPGTIHAITIDSAQTTANNLRQYVFVSWSDLGARTHDITGQLAGDSISATVTTRLRLQATISGNGTVASYPAGNVTAGIYIRKDSTAALKATPAAGRIFGGWSGDTVTTADSLDLTVSKPYTLVASFQDPLVASAGTPAGPVMGKAYTHTLTATGGSGSYSWQVIGWALPDGLSLSTSGVITGTPTNTGSFTATVRVTSSPQTATTSISLTVTAPTLVTADVVSQILLTRTPLSAADLKYLDLIGNNNGGFDAGDFLAWVKATGAPAPPMASKKP